ncbi:hypothetical protein [Ruminococcus albus]|uniref:Uncharacterized protein n=1 Tax=Ruminococcus albus (strain ATCC 27210 / DSM 20455 / JCM 14654 / NCDO 2250 / 7) TaxID=697329 RepID=E6UJT4_RUMA7|nr:hypothetical protein [Ruminococcus albus]ADU23930.1 hypothetical protein Rumal_3483 [Ruminococcus albus 7 = DSM 20455]
MDINEFAYSWRFTEDDRALFSESAVSNSNFYDDFKKWQRESWREIFGN